MVQKVGYWGNSIVWVGGGGPGGRAGCDRGPPKVDRPRVDARPGRQAAEARGGGTLAT
jgi:hypothetical protein